VSSEKVLIPVSPIKPHSITAIFVQMGKTISNKFLKRGNPKKKKASYICPIFVSGVRTRLHNPPPPKKNKKKKLACHFAQLILIYV